MKKYNCKIILLINFINILTLFITPNCHAFDIKDLPIIKNQNNNSQIIPQEQAFGFELIQINDNTIEAYWQIDNSAYLYQSKINVKLNNNLANLKPYELPKGLQHTDEVMGEQIIYKDQLKINLEFAINDSPEVINLPITIYYQGCAESGFCYPPQQKTFVIHAVNGNINNIEKINGSFPKTNPPKKATAISEINQNHKILKLLENKNIFSIFLGFIAIGLVLSLTPCVLPMLPILSTLIVGKENLKTNKAFKLSTVYVLAMAASYAGLGIIVAMLGHNLQAAFQSPIIITAFACLFFILGLELAGIINIHLPSFVQNKLQHLQNKQKSGSYFSAISLGVLATIVASPCVTAPLVAVLAFISQSGSTLIGGLSLFGMGLGMGVPLIIAGTLGGKYLPKAGPWMNAINVAFSIILFAFAIWILERFLVGPITMILWTLLCLYAAHCMGSFKLSQGGIWPRIGILFICYAALLSAFTLQGSYDPLKPFKSYWTGSKQGANHELNFTIVDNIQDLNQEILSPRKDSKPTLVTFYADWCVICKKIERTTFKDASVIEQLEGWNLVKANITKNNKEQRELLKQYQLVGPPSMLFFSPAGNEQINLRLVGDAPPKLFIQQLNQFKACARNEFTC